MRIASQTTAQALSVAALLGAASSVGAEGAQDVAITAFNKWCFKAGQTEADARRNMNTDAGPLTLTLWDDSLETRPAGAPHAVERHCEVAISGQHTIQAITAVRNQMQTPPVFGTTPPLPDTHTALKGTALIEARELLRGRVAVVHVGTRTKGTTIQTYLTVDRLYEGLGLEGAG